MRKTPALSAIVGVLLGALGVSSPLYANDDIKLTPVQAQAMGVATAPLSPSGTPAGKGFPARVAIPARQQQIISVPVAGLVESVAVAPGQTVKKGQLLARLQSPGLLEIQRGFLQAATQAQLARETMSRDEKLFQDGIIAESRYLASKSRHIEAAAALSERRQSLRLAGLGEGGIQRLEKSQTLSGAIELTAPISGVVLEQMAVPGQRAEAATPLYKLAQLSPLWLEIQAPVAQAAGLKPGVEVSVPAHSASGKVILVNRGVEEGSQTVALRAEISRGAENLWPGQFVEATLALNGGGQHWHVPNSAVVRLRDQAYVFVQTAAGFRAQAVKLEGETRDNTAIAGEFKGDERIAVRGTASLKAMWQGMAAGE